MGGENPSNAGMPEGMKTLNIAYRGKDVVLALCVIIPEGMQTLNMAYRYGCCTCT